MLSWFWFLLTVVVFAALAWAWVSVFVLWPLSLVVRVVLAAVAWLRAWSLRSPLAGRLAWWLWRRWALSLRCRWVWGRWPRRLW